MAHGHFAHCVHVEGSALQHNRGGRGRYLSAAATHNTAQGHRALPIGNHYVIWRQLNRLAAQQCQRFALPRHTHAKLPAAKRIVIISMGWLGRHKHHVIRRIHNVINRLCPHRHQLALQPKWARRHLHAADCHRHKAWHKLRNIVRNREWHTITIAKYLLQVIPRRAGKWLLEDASNLARHTQLAKAIWPVGKHLVLDIKHIIIQAKQRSKVSPWLQRFTRWQVARRQRHNPLVVGTNC